jgi:hypothetical protein
MTDPAISAFLGNTAMGANLLSNSAAVLGTDWRTTPCRDKERGGFLTGDERDRLRFPPFGAAENGAQGLALDWQEIIRAG